MKMNFQSESTKKDSHLPRTGKQNRTKNGKRRPMTKEDVVQLYDKPFDQKTFQRIAQRYYKTNTVGTKLWLVNEITENCVVINFEPDNLGYIIIAVISYNQHVYDYHMKKPRFNSDLFKKIVSKQLL